MRRQILLPLLLWVFGLIVLLALSERERGVERERIALESRVTGEQMQLRMESCVRSRVAVVRALATNDWQSESDIRARWRERATPLYRLYAGVQALNFVDASGVIRVVVPSGPNQAALEQSLRNNPNPSVPRALAAAEQGTISRTSIIELLQSGRGFAVYDLLRSPLGEPIGFVNGVFRVEDLMSACMFDQPVATARFRIALIEPGREGPFFLSGGASGSTFDWPLQAGFDVTVADRPWRLVVAPTPDYLARFDGQTADLIAFVGFAVVSLLAWLTWLLLVNQRSLEESQQKYRFIVENQNDLVVQLDARRRFAYVSPSVCRIMGCEEDDLVGLRFNDLIHSEDRAAADALFDLVERPPYQGTSELRTATVNGTRWIEWSCGGAIDEDGELMTMTCSGRDQTELHAMEDRVAHSQKMQALGELAGGITHDFNNLLQVMLGNVEFLLEELDGEKAGQLRQVEHAIQRAITLTGKLSTLSRQEQTRQRQLELGGLLTEIVDLLRRTLPSGIVIHVDSDLPRIYVSADATQIEQVVLNLCFNARDALGEFGNIRLELSEVVLDDAFIKTHPELELAGGSHARLAISDDGPGIAADILPRVFDPYFTTKRAGGGHGLGLANCDSIVRQHGGTLLVDSTPGVGTTFTAYLPTASAAMEESPAPEPVTPERASGKDTILIVDDNPDIVRLSERILSRAGYRTLTAANGHDAVVVFEEHRERIRMVVMDLVMPVMDGREAAARIRELAADVFILFASGYVPEARERPDLPGPLLRKPFKSEALLRYAAESERDQASD